MGIAPPQGTSGTENIVGTLASPPSPGFFGRIFYATDENQAYIDDNEVQDIIADVISKTVRSVQE